MAPNIKKINTEGSSEEIRFSWMDISSDSFKSWREQNNPNNVSGIVRARRYERNKFFAIVMALLLLIQMQPFSFSFAEDGSDAAKAETTASDEIEKTEPVAESAPEPKAEPKPEPKPEAEPAAEPAATETPAAEQTELATEDASASEEQAAAQDAETAEEQPAEEEKEDEEKYPAQTLTANAGGVKVTLKAPEGSLPEGSKLKAHQVGQQYINAVEDALEAQGRTLTDAVAIDVTPVNKDGKEIQPKKSVRVSFSGAGLDIEEGGSVDVFRVSDDASSVTDMGGSGSSNKQTFSTSHFTIYVAGGSSSDPNADGTNQPNSANHRYVLAYGESVTLQANTSSSSWYVKEGSSYARLSNTDNYSAVVTNINTTNQDHNVTIQHHRSSNIEYYYIVAKGLSSHNVTFMLKDAGESSFEELQSSEVDDGDDVTAPAPASPKAVAGSTYVFDGWYADEACTQEAVLTNITEDKTFYGKYDVTGHDVTFMLQDAGESSFEELQKSTIDDGDDATAPEPTSPKTVGGKTYIFDGWYEDESCTQEADLTNITSPKTFYGKYNLGKHNVTFKFQDAGESSFTNEKVEEVESGSDVTAPSHDDTKTAGGKTYKFSGWCSDEACEEPAVLTNITEDKTFYAKYVAEVKLSFEKNSGTDAAGVPADVEDTAGTKVTLGKATRDGWVFKSWNTKADGTGDSYGAGADFTLPEDDVKLYAQWTKEYIDVVYHNNYSGAEDVFYTDEGVAEDNQHYVIIADMPTRQNYIFTGWATTESGNPEYGPKETCPTAEADLHLYAQWTPYDPSHLLRTSLTAKGKTVPYNGSEYTIEDVEEMDTGRDYRKYGSQGYVRVSDISGDSTHHHIYAKIDEIKASGTEAGDYDTPLTAPLYTHNNSTGAFDALGESIPITNYTLEITPAKLTVSTESAEKLYDGEALTAGGTVKIGDVEHAFTNAGTIVTLLNGENLKIKTTGMQTEVGSSQNGYEIHWKDSTASANNYEIVEGDIGALEVYANKVKYNGNAGSDVVSGLPENADAGSEYVIPNDKPTRDHYTFKKWNTKADGKGDDYQPGQTYTFPAGKKEVTFYAIWEADKHTVKYDPNGGTFRGSEAVTTDGEYEYGKNIKIAEEATREAYHFTGWNTKKDGSGTNYQANDTYEVEADVTFYAQWKLTKGKYKFVHYFEQQDGSYEKRYWDGTQFKPCTGHEGAERTSGTQVDVVVEDYSGYTYNESKSVISGKVYFDDEGNTLYITDASGAHIPDPAGGDLKEFRLYYDLNKTTVKYEWEGTYPKNPTDLTGKEPETKTHKYGEKVYIDTTYKKNVTEVDGETFQGWQFHREIPIETDAGGQFFYVPDLTSVTLYGHWNMDEGFYTYKHYFEQPDGTFAPRYWNGTEFVSCEGHKKPASTNDVVNLEYESYTGYEAHPTHEDALSKGTVEIDQSGNVKVILDDNGQVVKKGGSNVTEFSLYYKYKKYTVTYNYRGTTVPPNPNKPANGTKGYVNAYYGQTINDVYKLENGSATYAKGENYVGYIFQGWETKHEGVELDGKKLVMPARNVNLEGTWKPAEDTPYKVEYYKQDINAETYTKDDKETTNEKGTTDTDATFEDKEFDGFTYEKVEYKNEGGKISGDGTQVVKVYYTRDKHNITYDPNGGKYKGSTDPTTEQHPYEAKVKIGEEPTREHYTFKGWKDGEGKLHQPGADFTVPNKDTTFTAEWERIQHNVKYDPNGGTYKGSTDPTTTKEDEGATIKIGEEPTREHYIFKGWEDEEGKLHQPGADFTVPNKDATFTAKWEPLPKITYDPNGGTFRDSDEPTSIEYMPGEAVEIAEAATRDHHVFKGWKDSEGIVHQAGDKDIEFSGDVVLTAVWDKEILKLYFNPNGGEFRGTEKTKVIEYEYGDTIRIPEAPVREGYEFLYWEGSRYYPGDSYTVTEEHRFVARWVVAADAAGSRTTSKKSGGSVYTGDSSSFQYFYILFAAMIMMALVLYNRRRELLLSAASQVKEKVPGKPVSEAIRLSDSCNFRWTM